MERIASQLLNSRVNEAKTLANKYYPFEIKVIRKRHYTKKQMLEVFIRDGFIDRYSGEKLYHPGFLRFMNYILPEQFPFHPHGKFNQCHDIYWDLFPSVDHFNSLYRGGEDVPENYLTTSMKRNLAKNNWSIEELGWKLHPPGDFNQWDGQTDNFLKLVEKYEVENGYIQDWYRITRKKLEHQ